MPTATLLENIAAYDELRGHLETKSLGKWVIFYDHTLEGEYDDFQVAAAFAVKTLRQRAVPAASGGNSPSGIARIRKCREGRTVRSGRTDTPGRAASDQRRDA